MEHYVTLFDSLFLPQGLALQASMERHVNNYTLWILCVDDAVYEILVRLNLPNVQLLLLSNLETDELRTVKLTRSKTEYCWTLTPFAPRFVFEANDNVSRVTYLDADMWFRKPPDPIFHLFEHSNKSALITRHGYSPKYDQSHVSGEYCVQFVIFDRHKGEKVRQWWEDRCIEWCHSYYENGKFGDQKYLEAWLKEFPNDVFIYPVTDHFLAPWNAAIFPYSSAVLWHNHGFRLAGRSNRITRFYRVDYLIPLSVYNGIYDPYEIDIENAIAKLNNLGYSAKPQIVDNLFNRLKRFMIPYYKLISTISLFGHIKKRIICD